MKKYVRLLSGLVMLCGALSFSGCGTLDEIAPTPAAKPEPAVIQAGGIAEYAHLSKSVAELCADSEVIMECVIRKTSASMADGSARVYTLSEVEPVQIYKGEYNGELLSTIGGTIGYGAYYNGLDQWMKQDRRPPSEENENTVVEYQLEEIPLLHEGDRIIFFGMRYEDKPDRLSATNACQGIYVIQDDSIQLADDTVTGLLLPELCEHLRAEKGDSVSVNAFTDYITSQI